ncbi:WD40 repeat domain-containing protein [archaeon]|nr:MAG: WD40 repeat domain-containing protein [archaeon]
MICVRIGMCKFLVYAFITAHVCGWLLGEIVDTDHNKMTLMFEGDSSDGVTSLVITNTHHPLIVSGHYDAMVRLWCIRTKQLTMYVVYVVYVYGCVGTYIIAVPHMEDIESNLLITIMCVCMMNRVLEGHQDYVGSVAAWRGHLPYIVSGSSDGTIKV